MNEFEFRILELLDGTLSDEEFAVLQSELLQNAGAREAFKRFARLHSDLEIRYASTAKIEGLGVVPVERIIARQRKRVVKVSLMAAAALLLISGMAMWLILTPDPPVSIATFQTAPNSIFTLTHGGDGDGPDGDVLTEGSRIRLVSGTLEGIFETGVRVIVEAPCDFSVLKKNRISLERGVGWFQVPEKATGFAVETPEMTVVDLGTEFGVIAADRGEDEVHVIKGVVEVTARAEDGEKQVLEAGEARRVTSLGRLQAITPDSSRFRKKLLRTLQVAIGNHSFEADDVFGLPNNLNTDIVPTGWTGFDDGRNNNASGKNRGLVSHAPGSVVNPTLGITPDPADADQSFYTAQRDIYQVLSAPLQADCVYTLTVDIGDRDEQGVAGNPGTPVINLGTGTAAGDSLLTPKVSTMPAQIDGEWVTWSFSYVTGPRPAGLGELLRIELTTGENVGWFDNIQLTVTDSSK